MQGRKINCHRGGIISFKTLFLTSTRSLTEQTFDQLQPGYRPRDATLPMRNQKIGNFKRHRTIVQPRPPPQHKVMGVGAEGGERGWL